MSMTTSPATEFPTVLSATDSTVGATRAPPSDGIRAFHYGTKQHVATSGAVALGGVLDLVVADSILAGDEHHGGRRHPAQITGIVAGAADDRHGIEAELLRALLHRGDTVGVELHR